MMALMNDATKNEANKPKYESKNLPIEQIIPNPVNMYSMEGIDELADSILLAGRVLQNIVVKAKDENGKYMIISGHRRHEACKKLVAAGHGEFAEIPALIENEANENLRELMLIYTNSTSRILTDAEKMRQAQRATELLKNLKAEGKFTDKIRETVARMLNTTETQLARYSAIANNLTNPELKTAFDDGRLGVSAAYEASRLSEDGQKQIADKLQEDGAVNIQDVKEVKEQEKPAETKTNGEGIPMKEVKLNLLKKFNARATVYIIEHEGKFYSDSDVWYKSGGWSGFPTVANDKPYNSEQEAIEAEIKEIADRNEELHRVLWKSGYIIVGDPAEPKAEPKSEELPAQNEPSASVEEDADEETQEEEIEQDDEPPAEEEEETPAEEIEAEEEPSEEEIKDKARTYAFETVLNELTALQENYAGAAERQIAMGGNKQGAENLKATAKYLQNLIDRTKIYLVAQNQNA